MVLLNSLNPLKAKNLHEGKYADGQGLWLVKSERTRGKWVLRVVLQGKRREMGLGRWPDVSIAEARELAAEARRKARSGIDPISERVEGRSAAVQNEGVSGGVDAVKRRGGGGDSVEIVAVGRSDEVSGGVAELAVGGDRAGRSGVAVFHIRHHAEVSVA